MAADRLVAGLSHAGWNCELWGIAPKRENEYVGKIEYGKGLLERGMRKFRDRQSKRLPGGYAGMSSAGAIFSSDRSAHGTALRRYFDGADLLHFHWVCDLLDYSDCLREKWIQVPLVWTLHDMSPFTGGCSYSLGCEKYEGNCADCPQLAETEAKAEAKKSLSRKVRAMGRMGRGTVITPSHWLGELARRSAVFAEWDLEVIPNGVDLTVFAPDVREAARRQAGLGESDFVILFVAASLENPLKGMDTLLEGLGADRGSANGERIRYLGGGGREPFPENWEWLGSERDERRLAEHYAAADLVVVPSRADNYPNVIAESLSCGTPVLASRVGGIVEMVKEGETGFLVEPGEAASLAEGLKRGKELSSERREELRRSCRRFAVETLDLKKVSRRHGELYTRLLADGQGF